MPSFHLWRLGSFCCNTDTYIEDYFTGLQEALGLRAIVEVMGKAKRSRKEKKSCHAFATYLQAKKELFQGFMYWNIPKNVLHDHRKNRFHKTRNRQIR